MSKFPKGFAILKQRTLTAIATALGIISANTSKSEILFTPSESGINPETNNFQKLRLKPQLVLKLNAEGTDHLVSMHTSHSSHRSHSSHSSHTSHYSASPSYTPSNTVPYTAPGPSSGGTPTQKKSTTPTTPSPARSGNSYSGTNKTAYGVWRRLLYKGCKGDDVTRLQQLLKALGYASVLVTGYFGDKTEAAVMAFQVTNELDPTGKVDYLVFQAMLNSLK